MRIEKHPILSFTEKKDIPFMFEGQQVLGKEGDTIASALINLGVTTFSHSIVLDRPRGFYCAIGNCSSCQMTVNNRPNVKTCITTLEPNMEVFVQKDKGVFK